MQVGHVRMPVDHRLVLMWMRVPLDQRGLVGVVAVVFVVLVFVLVLHRLVTVLVLVGAAGHQAHAGGPQHEGHRLRGGHPSVEHRPRRGRTDERCGGEDQLTSRRAQVAGANVQFNLGYTHAIDFPVPEGIQISVEKQTKLVVTGIDRQQVGQVAAKIRSLRAPDVYKGKGIRYVGEILRVPPSRVFGVATFYHYFTLKPQGEHTCVVCTGTACYINGAAEILASIREGLGVKPRETTTNGKLSLLTARCLGACSLAPAAIVDGEVEGRVQPREFVARLEKL